MTVVRRLARPLLSAVFVQSGIDQLRHPGPRVEAARPVAAKLSGPLHLPRDPETLVRVNGAVMTGAGTLFALGRFPRLSALLLAGTLVPTTYAGHPFWSVQDPQERRAQRTHFLKNLGLLGGVLLAAVDTEGRPGLAWRTKHATRDAKRAARHAKTEARLATRHARKEAQRAAKRAGDAVHL